MRPFLSPGAGRTVSTAGGTEPKWRSDGQEIYYLQRPVDMPSSRKLMAVEISIRSGEIQIGPEVPLFEVLGSSPRNHYAPALDGRRFLVMKYAAASRSSPITVVLNWTADLKR